MSISQHIAAVADCVIVFFWMWAMVFLNLNYFQDTYDLLKSFPLGILLHL
jgi:hypothetical protein